MLRSSKRYGKFLHHSLAVRRRAPISTILPRSVPDPTLRRRVAPIPVASTADNSHIRSRRTRAGGSAVPVPGVLVEEGGAGIPLVKVRGGVESAGESRGASAEDL